MNSQFPKINLIDSMSSEKLNVNMQPMRMDSVNANSKVSFSQTLLNAANNLNETVNAPETVMQDMLQGNGADIHDVITAINKAELSVSVATQITTKVIQAYEKIMNIQV